MENILYWLWLTTKARITSTKITHLLERYESIRDIYETTDYSRLNNFSPSLIAALNDKSLEHAREVYKRTEEAGARVLAFDDKDYPDMLRNIIDPPYVLYVKGENLPWDRLFTIGVVGTRKCDPYGRMATMNISRDLARMGVTVVSGKARGIDSIAAEAALRVGAKTIAVLGSGIDVIYPPENDKLYDAITKNGAVVTEYPPKTPALPTNFPIRNRIIVGLSRGVLVTQAPKRSGARISARCALENNRDVFAVPGDIFQMQYAGTNEIIKSYAKPITCANDIIVEYPYETGRMKLLKGENANDKSDMQNTGTESVLPTPVYSNSIQVSVEDKKYANLKPKEKEIIKLLIESNLHTDEIIRKTGIPTGELNTIMVLLEMNGMVKRLPGNNYKLKL